MSKKITRQLVDRIWQLVGYGLPSGLGERGKGSMCVQASVQAALGETHNDQPLCVPGTRKSFGIYMNDMYGWSGNQARGDGLRRYAIAQLGDSDMAPVTFAAIVIKKALQTRLPILVKAHGGTAREMQAAKKVTNISEAKSLLKTLKKPFKLSPEVDLIIVGGTPVPSHIITTLYPGQIANDEMLSEIAEFGVQACIEMKTEGSEWLKEYESRSGADLVDWLMKEKEKGRKQEEAAARFKDLQDFLTRNKYEPKQRFQAVETVKVKAANK